jgi:23S rRNA (adenine2503-C2)-methyltransferase
MGLSRGLSVDEMVGQVVLGERVRRRHPVLRDSPLARYDRVSNVVYMGMGEPLDNLEAVLGSLVLFFDDKGFRLSPNKVTVSTVGLMPALAELLAQSPVSVALSLHSPFDEERSRLIAANRLHPVRAVLDAMREASQSQRRSFMIQYLLLSGVNDSERHAEALADALQGIRAKVNLIPFNEHEGVRFRRPEVAAVYAFQQALKGRGLVATVRMSKGRDIQAACGQLIAPPKSP